MITISMIAQFLEAGENLHALSAASTAVTITRPAAIAEAQPGEVAFCGKTAREPQALITQTHASLLILDRALAINQTSLAENGVQAVIYSENARLDFIRVINHFFPRPRPQGIHPSAVISESARIDPEVSIGPLCSVGRHSEIGSGSVIHAGVQIYDNVRIGRNVILHAGVIVGGEGFGFERNAGGELEKFPQVGGVIIEDDVEVCGNTHIARGTLGDTVIGRGTKIDALVHVGHNIRIGQYCVITANAMLAAATIGDRSWIAPSATLRDRIHLDQEVLVGLGAVVTRDVPTGMIVFGSPARPEEEQKRLLAHWAEVIEQTAGG